MRLLGLVYRAFDRVVQPLGWVLFLGGLVCVVLTWPVQVLPPIKGGAYQLLITCLAWLLVSIQGFQMIAIDES